MSKNKTKPKGKNDGPRKLSEAEPREVLMTKTGQRASKPKDAHRSPEGIYYTGPAGGHRAKIGRRLVGDILPSNPRDDIGWTPLTLVVEQQKMPVHEPDFLFVVPDTEEWKKKLPTVELLPHLHTVITGKKWDAEAHKFAEKTLGSANEYIRKCKESNKVVRTPIKPKLVACLDNWVLNDEGKWTRTPNDTLDYTNVKNEYARIEKQRKAVTLIQEERQKEENKINSLISTVNVPSRGRASMESGRKLRG